MRNVFVIVGHGDVKKIEERRDMTTANVIAQFPGRAVSSAGALLVVAALVLASPSKAFGYADPGTGAFVYQAVYAGFLAATLYLRKILNRLWGKRKK